jgi:hypothetical protein
MSLIRHRNRFRGNDRNSLRTIVRHIDFLIAHAARVASVHPTAPPLFTSGETASIIAAVTAFNQLYTARVPY